MNENATSLYSEMAMAITACQVQRQVEDPSSPCKSETIEASFGRQFVLHDICRNVPAQRVINRKWAVANILHFFSASEDATALRSINPEAERFLEKDGRWDGAYGAIAIPQVNDCIKLLNEDLESRRAVVEMGHAEPRTINRPACWSNLHFMMQYKRLHLHCYQRSLHLHRVMPYDLTVLTNLLNTVAWALKVEAGFFYWTIGSLHITPQTRAIQFGSEVPVLLPPEVLINSKKCRKWLEEPDSADEPWRNMLCS